MKWGTGEMVPETLFIGELSPTGKKDIGELGPVTKNPWVIWAAQKNIGDLGPTEKNVIGDLGPVEIEKNS